MTMGHAKPRCRAQKAKPTMKLTNGATLTNANFSQANLTGANIGKAPTDRRTSPGPKCGGRSYWESRGPTLLDGQLPGPRFDRNQFGGNNLTGVNLADQNLTNANFDSPR